MVEFTIFIPHMAVYFNRTFTISNVDKPIVAKVFAPTIFANPIPLSILTIFKTIFAKIPFICALFKAIKSNN